MRFTEGILGEIKVQIEAPRELLLKVKQVSQRSEITLTVAILNRLSV